MALSQTRMIALLNAAIDYRQAFLSLVKQIELASTKPTAAAADELRRLYLRAGSGLLEQPADTETTIIFEWKHFRANARRNERVAEKQRLQRRAKGIPERKQADVGLMPITGRVNRFAIDYGDEREFHRGITVDSVEIDENRRQQIDEYMEQEERTAEEVQRQQLLKGKKSASEIIAEASRLGIDVSDGAKLQEMREAALKELSEITARPSKQVPSETEAPASLAGFDLEDDDGEEVGGVRYDDDE